MPLGGLVTAILPALIGAGGAIGGSLLGKGSINPYQKQAYNLLNANAQATTPLANRMFGRSGMFFNDAQNALRGPTNFFQSLLSGSPSATTSALAPDINRIRGGTQQTLQAQSTLAPRGGGRSGSLFNLPFQNQGQISGLFNFMRPQAATGLTGIGGLLGNLGLGTGQLGTNLFNSGNYASGLMGNIGGGFANQMAQTGAQAGSGITNILNSLFGTGGAGGGLLGGGFMGGGGKVGGFDLGASTGNNPLSTVNLWP